MQKQHFNVIVLLTGLFLGLNTMLFAEEEPAQPQSEIKGEVVQGVPVKAEVVEKALPNYTLTLKQLIEEAGKNIKKVEKEIEKKEIFEKNKTKEKHKDELTRLEQARRQKEEELVELERRKMRPYQIDIALKEQERLREKEIERRLRKLGEKN